MDLQNSGELAGGKVPDFSTLSEIMDYFHQVPFETFKETLSTWFLRELPSKRPDLVNSQGVIELPPGLVNLIDAIFKTAEETDQSHLN